MILAEAIVTGIYPPGLYRLARKPKVDYLIAPLVRQGWRGFYIGGQVVSDKASFLRSAGNALEFPAYYGQNWDAFEECITDLTWAPAVGYVLVYDYAWRLAWHDQQAWQTVLAILSDATTYWHTKETPFYVLLRRTRWYARDLPKLP